MTGRLRRVRAVLAVVLSVTLAAGVVVGLRWSAHRDRMTVVAYFENTTGLFAGDPVWIRGVPIGAVAGIEPQPERAKVTFWIDSRYRVPADVQAVILSPQLVTGRAIQLTPPYRGGPTLADGAVIPLERTAIPVEWDDLRVQLERVTELLKPTGPNGISTLGAMIDSAAENLRGQGHSIRDAVVRLSRTVTTLTDQSDDVFATVKNLATLVSALRDSADLLERLNTNLAAVSGLLADDPDKIGRATDDLAAVVTAVRDFAAEHTDAIGTTSERAAAITTALVDSIEDIKQTLHIAPTVLQNFNNMYEPANGSLTGALAINNFANPIEFLCGAVQSASRLGSEQSARLCVQYLAPIVKNRQYNFPPLGVNLFVGAQARPNEITYSEEWMRPDHVPPTAPEPGGAVTTDPAHGLSGLMIPPGGGT
ncbi:hypothetical protein MHAS_00298 [Mycolicibacterium hassiacum DSM 44199]|uniref:MCE family protein n=1 Tax=Mycolicibacterium hassiacum TaxID=46351 RepID=UPI0004772DE5|nr:MCE family protein [Mycolicibacterium hassiacum]MBX5489174.1 MCE family protein [Mycolicibacterium hassiacum]VCT88614.1 hypothetical protein MHAS_00298 [Mycolicibacterium hassiacum DSM 44199]